MILLLVALNMCTVSTAYLFFPGISMHFTMVPVFLSVLDITVALVSECRCTDSSKLG